MGKRKGDKKSSANITVARSAKSQLLEADERQSPRKLCEQRLYAYPILKKRLADDVEYRIQLTSEGLPDYDKSILRYRKSGHRMSMDDIREAVLIDLNSRIASTEYEISQVDEAINVISKDYYSGVIQYKYFERLNDSQIAEMYFCDISTIRRNRSRLLRDICIYLYGVNGFYK